MRKTLLNRTIVTLTIVISVLSITAVAAMVSGNYLRERLSRNATESTASKVVVAKIKDVTFIIPKKYLGSPFGVDRFGFWMLLPLPSSHSGGEEGAERVKKSRKLVHKLRVNLDAKWPGSRALGMHYSIPKSARGPFAPPEPGPFGLTIERAIAKTGQPAQWTTDDLYTYGEIAKPEGFLSFHCQSEIATEGRQEGAISAETGLCEMAFLYRDFLVEVGFPKTRLAEWRYFHSYVKRMLDDISEVKKAATEFNSASPFG